jgi:hypothetical protein
MRGAALSLALLAVIGSLAGAQDTTSALIAGDRASSAELARILDAAQSSGLPVKPILTKISYGILMKASAPRIIAAARGTAARLEEARSALEPHPSESDIAAGENALSSRVSVKSLREIRRAAANRPLAVPLGVLSQLVASGVDEEKAAKRVTDLVRKGITAEMLADLGNAVNTDVQGGAKPNNSFDLRSSRLTAVLGVPGTAAAADLGLTAGAATPTPGGKKKP